MGGYTPPFSCREHMLQDLPNVFVGISEISRIVDDCILVVESRLQHLSSNTPKLTPDEALAIAAYSYDLSFADNSNNIYFALNDVLRERNPKKMIQLRPFLTYLMSGLSKLTAVEETVYRGIPISAMDMVREKYRLGIDTHWSAFTSTTSNIKKAKSFAQATGGIIFRIRILTGRSIKHYSAIPSEDEILLSPNCRLVVTSTLKLEDDGFYYLDLLERCDAQSFIF